MSSALTIAGSDPTGVAGLAADLKTFHAAGVVGRVVVTLVSVQGDRGLTRSVPMDPSLVSEQLHAVLDGVSAVKTGALGGAEVVIAVADILAAAGVSPIVDPVILTTSGHSLLDDGGERALVERLLPIACLVTPNVMEAEALTGVVVRDRASAERAGRAILALGARAVLVKGGHLDGPESTDVLVTAEGVRAYTAPRSPRRDVRGTGCSLSAAICASMARGASLEEAIGHAKDWLTRAIDRAPPHAIGRGAVDHGTPFPTRA